MIDSYLIIDSSSGSVRAGVVDIAGNLLSLVSRPINNIRDTAYPDALYFKLEEYNSALLTVCREAIEQAESANIIAVSAASQREGIVLIDKDGKGILGLPNIDNRGQEFEQSVEQRHRSYLLGGRWVSTLFPAVKLLGLKERQPELYKRMSKFTSISEYIAYLFTGKLVYETSQACETLLFDVSRGEWSEELCDRFDISLDCLPEIMASGELLDKISNDICLKTGIPVGTPFFVGGADTQMAAECCTPATNDLVIVAGTTTPIVCLKEHFLQDDQERCWVNRHVRPEKFIVETNVGVSGSNYQRAKEIFYPGESYETMEKDLMTCMETPCIASVGSMIFGEGRVTPCGGFILPSPLGQNIERKHFAYAVLMDYAYSFKNNYENIISIVGQRPQRVFGCGNGFASSILPQLMSDLIQQEIQIVDKYSYATIAGVHQMLSRSLNKGESNGCNILRIVTPNPKNVVNDNYGRWLSARSLFNPWSDLHIKKVRHYERKVFNRRSFKDT